MVVARSKFRFVSRTFISASWSRKEQDSVVLADAVAVGIACSSAHIPDHHIGLAVAAAGRYTVAVVAAADVAVDGVGIDSAVAVVVAHSRIQPDYCCCYSQAPCCWDNTHWQHRGHLR